MNQEATGHERGNEHVCMLMQLENLIETQGLIYKRDLF